MSDTKLQINEDKINNWNLGQVFEDVYGIINDDFNLLLEKFCKECKREYEKTNKKEYCPEYVLNNLIWIVFKTTKSFTIFRSKDNVLYSIKELDKRLLKLKNEKSKLDLYDEIISVFEKNTRDHYYLLYEGLTTLIQEYNFGYLFQLAKKKPYDNDILLRLYIAIYRDYGYENRISGYMIRKYEAREESYKKIISKLESEKTQLEMEKTQLELENSKFKKTSGMRIVVHNSEKLD